MLGQHPGYPRPRLSGAGHRAEQGPLIDEKHRSLPLVLAATLSLSACSSKTVSPKMYTGFLKDYSQLAPHQSPSGQQVSSWVSPALKTGRYKQVYLEPSQFYPRPEPTERIPAAP